MEHFEKFKSYIPFDLLQPMNFIIATVVLILIIIFRYFLLAGAFWLGFYKSKSPALKKRQIYDVLPESNQQLYEIKWSMYTSVVFGISGVLMGLMWQNDWTQIYLKFDQFGFWYLPLSFIVTSLVHDLYFYWTHRWLHLPRIFKMFHKIHHNSVTPSPWASFSFHPVEGVIQALALPLIVLIVPLHPVVILIYLTAMTLSAVSNHLGFEILPQKSERSWAKWFVSGVHHTQHHRYYRYNFSLFYPFFDVLFKTEHPHFIKDFSLVFKKNVK